MTGRAAEIAVYALLLVLPIAALVARRLPIGRVLTLIAVWIAIFAIGLLIVGQRDRFDGVLGRGAISGRETRIPIGADGHFRAMVTVDGVTRQMLIDSGATTTAISEATADAAGLQQDSPFPVVLNTANGQVTAHTGTVSRLVIGDIVATDVPVVVSAASGDMDVVGMNVLSRLARWRAQDGTLVLTPG